MEDFGPVVQQLIALNAGQSAQSQILKSMAENLERLMESVQQHDRRITALESDNARKSGVGQAIGQLKPAIWALLLIFSVLVLVHAKDVLEHVK